MIRSNPGHAFIGALVVPVLMILAFEAWADGAASGGGAGRTTQPGASRVHRYLTLNVGEEVDLSPGPVRFDGGPVLLRRSGRGWTFRAVASGHTVVIAGNGARQREIILFVTPTPSRQVGRRDLEWYRTQFGAGTADCGPALVSMAILWARSEDVPVRSVRAEIGYPFPNGATRLEDLQRALTRHGVGCRMTKVSDASDLVALLERSHLALVLIRSGGIRMAEGDPRKDLFGRYYDYCDGHYVLVKGFSLDRKYFVVYDPYPVDWDSNSLRYEDGRSMIGKNRYYPAPELAAALRSLMVLEVSRD